MLGWATDRHSRWSVTGALHQTLAQATWERTDSQDGCDTVLVCQAQLAALPCVAHVVNLLDVVSRAINPLRDIALPWRGRRRVWQAIILAARIRPNDCKFFDLCDVQRQRFVGIAQQDGALSCGLARQYPVLRAVQLHMLRRVGESSIEKTSCELLCQHCCTCTVYPDYVDFS